MANDEYQLPISISNEHAPQTVEFVEVPAEQEPVVSTRLMDSLRVANEIFLLRSSADETVIPRRLARRVFEGIVQTIGFSLDQSVPLEHRLIDLEAEIVGRSLPKTENVVSQRFWLDTMQTLGVHDFYYETVDSQGVSLAHYAVSEAGVEKLSKSGRLTPLVKTAGYDEEAVLFTTIDTYLGVVQRQLYSKQSDYDLAA